MALTVNHYNLLGVGIDATTEEIDKAYRTKTEKFMSGFMQENYKTAYYVLSDPCRREQYDLSLGIHKYRKVPLILKVIKAHARVLLTIMDALLTFYWCLLIVLLIYGGILIYMSQEEFLRAVMQLLNQNHDLIIVLGGFAFADVVLHFYVRRANRFLKHYNWEYRIRK